MFCSTSFSECTAITRFTQFFSACVKCSALAQPLFPVAPWQMSSVCACVSVHVCVRLGLSVAKHVDLLDGTRSTWWTGREGNYHKGHNINVLKVDRRPMFCKPVLSSRGPHHTEVWQHLWPSNGGRCQGHRWYWSVRKAASMIRTHAVSLEGEGSLP